MQVKTIRARDLAGALRRARAELGPDALVLDTRTVDGGLGLDAVEITVAVDRPSPAREDVRGELERLGREVRRLQGAAAPAPAPASAPAPAAVRTAAASGAAPRALVEAAERLVGAGLAPDLAERFRRIAERDLGPRPDDRGLARAAAAGIAGLLPFRRLPETGGALFVVGPPGCGKTTTVAKLAARCDDAVYVQADRERIGANEQARIFTAAMGLRLETVDSAARMRDLVASAAPGARLYVDTCGVGPADDARLDALRRLRDAAPDAGCALLLPAGLHADEAAALCRRFAAVRPTCVAISKVDGARRLGELLTAVEPTGLPLSFTTHGHDVPDDLEPATPGALAALLLRPRAEAPLSEMHA